MKATRYAIDPKEVYTLELEKLQRRFSEVQKVGEGVSDLSRVSWQQVEHLRQVNFLLEQAAQAGETILKIAS